MLPEGWHYAHKQQGYSVQQGEVFLWPFLTILVFCSGGLVFSQNGSVLLCRPQENSSSDFVGKKKKFSLLPISGSCLLARASSRGVNLGVFRDFS